MEDFTPLDLFGDDEVVETAEPIIEEEETMSTVEDAEVLNADAEEPVAEEVAKEPVVEDKEVVESDTVFEEDDISEKTDVEDKPVVDTEPDPSKLDAIIENQQQLLEKIENLDALFSKKIMHSEHEEKIIDQMHKELQKYKEDMYSQLVRPILLDIIEVRESIMRIAATYLAKPEGEQDIPNKTFFGYSYDMQDILEKNSIEIYKSESGSDFVPLKQRVVKKEITADESLHGKVAESASSGYIYNGRVISAEKVAVYFYEKPVEENENSEVIDNG